MGVLGSTCATFVCILHGSATALVTGGICGHFILGLYWIMENEMETTI